ncbi:two-component system, NarL family, sensor histidine kinase NreB [Oceanobacillus limi]|uniref:histidine kinase n=1 Tax=Oceanobacillus limi TaxID=930131 RepID=A0A1I0B7N1_9BACI|nr:histidine kinase [Oceanobacillus limi]SET02407.1 two-component system, NarL family, sensor histidine kinase NreB [Oceanobacillus limi]
MEIKSIKDASTYIIQSQEEELKRIAIELHEGVGQNLFSLYTGLEYLQTLMEDPVMKNYAKDLSALMNRTIQEIRFLSVELYPNTLSNLGLFAALKSYIKLFSSTFGIQIHIVYEGEEKPIEESCSLSIFRSCQEALINIAKHADVDEATFRFTWGEKSLKIDIIDNGKGFNVQEVKENNDLKGLAAMKHRMEFVGGDFLLTSELDKGTAVSLIMPFLTIGKG